MKSNEIEVVILEHPESGLMQILAVADLVNGGVDVVSRFVKEIGEVDVLYCDPPWNPFVEQGFRERAGVTLVRGFDAFLDALIECIVRCNPRHVFCEQSWNSGHRERLLSAIKRSRTWKLSLLDQWQVNYGNPSRPNALLHWGWEYLTTDPTCWSGDAMVRRVFEGIELQESGLVVDPCVGLGTTSRIAHHFRQNFVGTDLNADKLKHVVNWLFRRGYRLAS